MDLVDGVLTDLFPPDCNIQQFYEQRYKKYVKASCASTHEP